MSETTAALSTQLLRTSDDPLFARLRELLPEHGVDPAVDVLADFFPDDVNQEFGVVVPRERRVLTFVLYYGRKGDLKAQLSAAVLADWKDLTSYCQASPYAPNVEDAFRLIDGGTGR